MARKRKKKDTPITESYEIKVEDWEVDYFFGINTAPKIIEGVYWGSSRLILIGNIIRPALEKANKARIEIAADPRLDDHWKQEPTILSAKAIGWMEMPRGDEKIIFNCSIPSWSLPYIAVAVQSGKIKYASISGTKLKWRRGTISMISLSMHEEDE